MNAVALIARREIVTRLQQKSYRIGFGIAMLIAVVGCALPALFTADTKASSYDIGLTAQVGGLPAALRAVGQAQGVRITVHDDVAPRTAVADVKSGDLDAVLLDGRVVAKSAGNRAVTLLQSAYQLAATLDQGRALTDDQVARAVSGQPLAVQSTASGGDTQKQTIAIIAVVVLFSQLITFCTWVAVGVVEEKSSRVVELVLSSVRPLQLLAGKLFGIGAVAAGQVLALGVAAIASATIAGTLTVPASAIVSVLVAFVGFLLGYAFFAAVAAALGSTVSRQEEVSGVLAPVTLTLTVCYAASFATASSPDSTFARLVSIVPPFSAIGMPARIARGGVAVLDVVLAVVLLVAATAAIIALAARIYRASVLHSGTRVPLRTAWRDSSANAVSAD